jgi:hypothetical protein
MVCAWELPNHIDFAEATYELSDCNETLNLTELMINESRYNPNFETLLSYMQLPNCENYARGTYHYLTLHDPKPTCTRFYNATHDWISSDYWNWGFNSCGIEFHKSDWDYLVTDYSHGFWLGELEDVYIEPSFPIYDEPNQTNITNKSQESDERFLGGGDNNKAWVWETWLFIGNYLWIELALLLLSLFISRLYWNSDTYKKKEDYSDDPFMNTNMSGFKKFQIVIFWFLIFSAIFWAAFYLFL